MNLSAIAAATMMMVLAIPVSADDLCGFCDRFESFSDEARAELAAMASERALFKTPVPIALSGSVGCGGRSRAPAQRGRSPKDSQRP